MQTMKFWSVRPRGDQLKSRLDVADGFVVKAYLSAEARRIASEQAGDEGSALWLDTGKAVCKELMPRGPSKVILRSFNAG